MKKPRDPRSLFLRIDTDDDGQPESFEFVEEIPDDVEAFVCVRVTVPLILPDNLLGRCDACGAPVQFRPVAVDVAPKICVECVPAWAEGRANPQ